MKEFDWWVRGEGGYVKAGYLLNKYIYVDRLTHRDQMTDVLQHYISVQLSLGCIQQGPFFLGEVYSYILEGHGFLKHHRHFDAARAFSTKSGEGVYWTRRCWGWVAVHTESSNPVWDPSQMSLCCLVMCLSHRLSEIYTLCKHNFFINDYLMRCGGNTQDTALPNFLQDQMGLLHNLDKQVWPCSSLHNTHVMIRLMGPRGPKTTVHKECPGLPLHFNLLGHLQALLITTPLVTSTSQLTLIFPVLQNLLQDPRFYSIIILLNAQPTLGK